MACGGAMDDGTRRRHGEGTPHRGLAQGHRDPPEASRIMVRVSGRLRLTEAEPLEGLHAGRGATVGDVHRVLKVEEALNRQERLVAEGERPGVPRRYGPNCVDQHLRQAVLPTLVEVAYVPKDTYGEASRVVAAAPPKQLEQSWEELPPYPTHWDTRICKREATQHPEGPLNVAGLAEPLQPLVCHLEDVVVAVSLAEGRRGVRKTGQQDRRALAPWGCLLVPGTVEQGGEHARVRADVEGQYPRYRWSHRRPALLRLLRRSARNERVQEQVQQLPPVVQHRQEYPTGLRLALRRGLPLALPGGTQAANTPAEHDHFRVERIALHHSGHRVRNALREDQLPDVPGEAAQGVHSHTQPAHELLGLPIEPVAVWVLHTGVLEVSSAVSPHRYA
mmetsp:Transcript_32051/g.89725  ORF Transcript_32051/g.89725 Transcript_32051/m.89725 type:complete len:391 (-) Transcript_32051:806-1978(-)